MLTFIYPHQNLPIYLAKHAVAKSFGFFICSIIFGWCNSFRSVSSYLLKVNWDFTYGGGCESYRGISGLGQEALQSEIGLYFDFEVNEYGIPYGCPGMQRFTPEFFNTSKIIIAFITFSFSRKLIKGRRIS